MKVIYIRGAIYIRVSTTDQLEFSPDAQKKAILNYAKRHDICINDKYIYVDEGISGRRAEKRPGFMNMIKGLKKSQHHLMLYWFISLIVLQGTEKIVWCISHCLRKNVVYVLSVYRNS